MEIKYKYVKDEALETNRVEVYANEAPIGILYAVSGKKDVLLWIPDNRVYNVRFQFRNKETFYAVVQELKHYKEKLGYKYLSISKYSNGFAAQIDEDVLLSVGFHKIVDMEPLNMYVE